MLDAVKARLHSLGYPPTLPDEWVLGFLIRKREAAICADCNLPQIPPELSEAAVDMVAGEFLLEKKASAAGLEGFDLEVAEKSIQAGDTRIEFAVDTGMSPEQRLDKLIARLLHPPVDLGAFRRLRW